MRFLIFLPFIFVVFLSSCIFVEKENLSHSIFQIEGRLGEKKVLGVGVCIAEKTILTSAHVVADDRYSYTASGLGIVAVSSRSLLYDTAILDIASGGCIPEKISQTKPQVGDRVFASVFRGGDIVTLSGKIIEMEKQGIGYSENGATQVFTSRIVSDMTFLPGDSGTPLFNDANELIDIAHTGR